MRGTIHGDTRVPTDNPIIDKLTDLVILQTQADNNQHAKLSYRIPIT